jgi:hypothetical protein
VIGGTTQLSLFLPQPLKLAKAQRAVPHIYR